MKTIWKYEIPFTGDFALEIPDDCTFLSVQLQNGKPMMWLQVDTSNETVPMKFCAYGTGWEMPEEPGDYLGTYQLNNGLVFHLYWML